MHIYFNKRNKKFWFLGLVIIVYILIIVGKFQYTMKMKTYQREYSTYKELSENIEYDMFLPNLALLELDESLFYGAIQRSGGITKHYLLRNKEPFNDKTIESLTIACSYCHDVDMSLGSYLENYNNKEVYYIEKDYSDSYQNSIICKSEYQFINGSYKYSIEARFNIKPESLETLETVNNKDSCKKELWYLVRLFIDQMQEYDNDEKDI